MELVRELVVTAGFALIFSFLVAKLVSMAMAADSKPAVPVDEETIAAELKSEEKLEVRGFVSEMRVESVKGTSEIVEKLEEKPAHADDAFESQFGSREIEVELESADKSGDTVEEEKLESGGVEVVEELRDQIHVVSESQEIGVEEYQSEGLVSLGKKEGEEEEEEKAVSDDDDWEGIERSELENKFAAAVKFVESQGNAESLENDLLMELYGLHKIATEGPCHESQPMALKVSARTKWNAWQRLGNMNLEEAMEQYISLLSDKVPGWNEGRLSKGEHKAEDYAESGLAATPTDMSSLTNPHTTIDARNSELISAVAREDATGGSGPEHQVKD